MERLSSPYFQVFFEIESRYSLFRLDFLYVFKYQLGWVLCAKSPVERNKEVSMIVISGCIETFILLKYELFIFQGINRIRYSTFIGLKTQGDKSEDQCSGSGNDDD